MSSSAPTPPGEIEPPKIKPTLTGSQATALIALYGRHLEAQKPADQRLLNDTYATETVAQLDYPFTNLHVGGGTVTYVGIRAVQLDGWTLDFISRHPTCTVINMACGLDSRALRLLQDGQGKVKHVENVRWIDVDLPDVVEVRRKVIPVPERRGVDYTLLAGSVTDEEFISSLPNDRPTILVMEGLSAYLQPEEGPVMIKSLCEHLSKHSEGQNEMVFEAINSFTISLQGLLGYLKRTESAVYWGVDDCKELEKLHEGLELVEEHPVCTLDGVKNSPLAGRIFWWCCSWFAASRNSLRHLRFRF
ncbi:S-adenosyl-L-methionine-dependent methyltransferase [Naviculisporaceae sp. PSN 640]